jgi:hypothetical protein
MRLKFSNPYGYVRTAHQPGVNPQAAVEMLRKGMQQEREVIEGNRLTEGKLEGLLSETFDDLNISEGHKQSIREEMRELMKQYEEITEGGQVNKLFTPEAQSAMKKIIARGRPGNYRNVEERYKTNLEDFKKASRENQVGNQLMFRNDRLAFRNGDGTRQEISLQEYENLNELQKSWVKQNLLTVGKDWQLRQQTDRYNSGDVTSYSSVANAGKVRDRISSLMNQSGKSSSEEQFISVLRDRLGPNGSVVPALVKNRNSSNVEQLKALQEMIVDSKMMTQDEMDAIRGDVIRRAMGEGREISRENIDRMLLDELVALGSSKVESLGSYTGKPMEENELDGGGDRNGKLDANTQAMLGRGHKEIKTFSSGNKKMRTVATLIPEVDYMRSLTNEDGQVVQRHKTLAEMEKLNDMAFVHERLYTIDGQPLPEDAAYKTTINNPDNVWFGFMFADGDRPMTVEQMIESPALRQDAEGLQMLKEIKSLEDQQTLSDSGKQRLDTLFQQAAQRYNMRSFLIFEGYFNDTDSIVEDSESLQQALGEKVEEENIPSSITGAVGKGDHFWNIMKADGLYKSVFAVPAKAPINNYLSNRDLTPTGSSDRAEVVDQVSPIYQNNQQSGPKSYAEGGKLLEGKSKLPTFEQTSPLDGIKFLNIRDLM